ncbi:hypothetical protein A3860_08830 [Niastella vici]|uniref:BioF2-like acetyltransferase domain-containing protein n=1 Tax=Niastella vici TaxID=1703345 RepID=A0A1V9FH85_9BACT|nr:GNAT family N-acetyltransferase [Niastella vici]OQP57725.1 hypothetical protein A3860_08830 [Niastella vici]
MSTTITKIKTFGVAIPPATASIKLLTGSAVLNLLNDEAFLDGWNRLNNACPWATVFQHPSFVATWYRVYENDWLPVLIKGEQAGKLTGLLTLAMDKKGLITGAGANQAEYQVWITADANDEAFIKNALQVLRRTFPRKKVLLKYVPAGVSLVFTKKDPVFKKRCFVKTSPQPVMLIDEAHFTSELKKKNRREKINRLKKMGELSFERITGFNRFVGVFDELALQSDFRKGAMYNKVAFKTDPWRKKFLLLLFQQNILHTTLLKINDKIVSANVSIGDNRQLHLQGINSFDAAYARYSPGIIHFLMLGKLLAQEGATVFDLTPGADGYKETLATDYSVAHTLSIGNNYHGFTNRLKTGLNNYLKNAATSIGIKRDVFKKGQRSYILLRGKCMHMARQGVASFFALFFNKLKSTRKTSKCWVVCKGFATSGLLNCRRDDLHHLLQYDQQGSWYSRQEFLADAMDRFTAGGHCYSWAEDGRLLACVWIASAPAENTAYKFVHETEGFIISLSALYCNPKGRKQFPLFLRSLGNVLALDNPHSSFYLLTDRNEDRAFEKAGFYRLQ